MRKAPFVLGSTVAGLALVLNYHSGALSITLPATGSGGGTSSGQGQATVPSAGSTLAAGTGSTPAAGAPPSPSGGQGSGGGASGGLTAGGNQSSGSSNPSAGADGSGSGPGGASHVAGGPAGSGTSTSGTPSPGGSAPTIAPPPITTNPTLTTQPPTTTTTAGPRVVTGNRVNYAYGSLQLQVTDVGGQITKITPVVDQASDSRSVQINSQALPVLAQEALQAQSASIHAVSGATYTSDAYIQSLQSALDQL